MIISDLCNREGFRIIISIILIFHLESVIENRIFNHVACYLA